MPGVTALVYDLRIEQGADYEVVFPVLDDNQQPVDVTAWQARAQVRRNPLASTVLQNWTLADDAGGLAMLATSVRLTVPADQSAGWGWRHGVWNLELVDPQGVVTRLVSGQVAVSSEVTR